MKLFGNGQKRGSRAASRAGYLYPGKNSVQGEKILKLKRNKSGLKRILLILTVVATFILMIGITFFHAMVKPPEPRQEEEQTTAVMQEQQDDEGKITVTEVAKRKEDFITMLVCGTDQDETRTDTIIFAAFDIAENQMHLINIPRDTLSDVERSIRKINSAYSVGGIDQLEKEVRMLLGVPVDRYVVVNFKGFAELVDAVGGLEYDVPITMKYDDPTQDLHIDIKKGLQPLDGEKAVQFMRFRQNNADVGGGYPNGDLGRIAAQQGFIKALAKKLLSPGTLFNVSDISKAILNNTKTDLTLGELVWMGLEAVKMDPDSISMQLLPGYDKYLYEPRIKMNQSYYIPQADEILKLVNLYFNPFNDPVTEIDVIDITQEKVGIVSKSTGTKAAESTSAETKQEKEPAETKPAETEPAETKPAETKPPETKPPETSPPATNPPSETEYPPID